MLSTIIIILHIALNIAAKYSSPRILYYDKSRYQYEDSLIRGDHHKHHDDYEDIDDLVRVQPLNYRLPSLPTSPPSFSSSSETKLTARLDSTLVLPCRVINLGSASVSWIRNGLWK